MSELVSLDQFFIDLLESQRDINTHIHAIEPSTPIYLFEIDLTEIKPATREYSNLTGPIRNGVIRVHNDYNLFNINRGVIIFGSDAEGNPNYYFPFPVYGEQFDITSNGSIPAPKIRISSQFLDDQYNSFYKYLRMQINELKDLAGAKVTRRKTFARYLPGNNFIGNVNPFQDFIEVPWASNDGDSLTVRVSNNSGPNTKTIPTQSLVWAIYYPQIALASNALNLDNKAIFTSPKTDDNEQIIGGIRQNFYINSSDHFRIIYSENEIAQSNEVKDVFNSDVMIFDLKNSNVNTFFNDPKYYLRNIFDNNIFQCIVNKKYVSGKNLIGSNYSNLENIEYKFDLGFNSGSINTFLSIKQRENSQKDFPYYKLISGKSSGINILFSEPIANRVDLFTLTAVTGYFTGINPISNETVNLINLKENYDFGILKSGDLNLNFPISFQTTPKIIFHAQSNTNDSGDFFNYKITNISSTGLKLSVYNTGNGILPLGQQNYQIFATDYIMEEGIASGTPQVFNVVNSFNLDIDNINIKNIYANQLELTPDIYYIDRKSQEDKTTITYELASLLDVEGVKLPSRLLLKKNCPFTYRGAGCIYEYNSRLTIAHSGIYGEVLKNCNASPSSPSGMSISSLQNYQQTYGLYYAPPVADENDKTFLSLPELNTPNEYHFNTTLKDKDYWSLNTTEYQTGDFVYIQKNNINYYFVCKTKHTPSSVNAPPNTGYWLSDTCSKTLNGCRLRWRSNPNFSLIKVSGVAIITGVSNQNLEFVTSQDKLFQEDIRSPSDIYGIRLPGFLPFGGFPSVQGKYSSQQEV